MVDSYLQALRSLLDTAGADVAGAAAGRATTIECKHFFSGAAGYADGRIFITLTPAGFCQNSDNDVQSGAIWGSETAFAESDGGPLDD